MQQLVLAISPPPAPSFDNFVPGENAELLVRLRSLASGEPGDAVLYVWGEPGSGRSHLLAATARAASGSARIHIQDDVEQLDDAAQIDLFNRINAAREDGCSVLAAGCAPPLALKLREDLRSRLGSGLVYQLRALIDGDKACFLKAEAERRGLRLSDEIIDYLLSRVRRDMPTLGAILDELDRYSLEQKRPITLPLVREALEAARRNP